MVVVAEEDRVNHGRTTSTNGEAGHYRRCCTLQTTEFDGQSLQQWRLLEYRQRRLDVMGTSRLVSHRP